MDEEKLDEQAMALPAAYVNAFQILVAGTNIRVAFGESAPNTPTAYRSAIVISSQDALNLVDQLLKAIKVISPPGPTTLGGILSGRSLINNATTPAPPGVLGTIYTGGSGGLFGYGKKDV